MTRTLLQLQVLNWWSFSYIISVNLFALLFHFLLINDVRMTTLTHHLLSSKTSTPEVWQCKCEYSSRSATDYGVRRSVAHVLCRSRFHPTMLKVRHHVTWCLEKTSYSTSSWDVAVTNGHSSRTVLPLRLSHRQKHRNLQRENLQFTEPNILSTE